MPFRAKGEMTINKYRVLETLTNGSSFTKELIQFVETIAGLPASVSHPRHPVPGIPRRKPDTEDGKEILPSSHVRLG
uniref:Uncharacterized protein n=1 Tax=Candidatus Kentrum sp. TC TaxID=2126339 RepID=A0A450Y9X8_9GAMM|nr:MAG: hypothetical protein BECKTC1821E_GA0114239_100253 [Candidatus Kentron sp. TC]